MRDQLLQLTYTKRQQELNPGTWPEDRITFHRPFQSEFSGELYSVLAHTVLHAWGLQGGRHNTAAVWEGMLLASDEKYYILMSASEGQQ